VCEVEVSFGRSITAKEIHVYDLLQKRYDLLQKRYDLLQKRYDLLQKRSILFLNSA